MRHSVPSFDTASAMRAHLTLLNLTLRSYGQSQSRNLPPMPPKLPSPFFGVLHHECSIIQVEDVPIRYACLRSSAANGLDGFAVT
jgi:hypothetical protein